METRISIAPDHKAFFVSMNVNEDFNNTLLQNECYLQLIKDCYPHILQKYANVDDIQLLWELIKNGDKVWNDKVFQREK